MRQAHEMALGGLMRALQQLLGPGWRPREVHLLHGQGAAPRAYREVFGVMPVFASGFNALVPETADLDRPIRLSDARPRQHAPAALAAQYDGRGRISPQTVRRQVMTLLSTGRCSASAVASALGVDRRTLNRHLRAEGRSYLQVANEVRLEQARQALRARRCAVGGWMRQAWRRCWASVPSARFRAGSGGKRDRRLRPGGAGDVARWLDAGVPRDASAPTVRPGAVRCPLATWPTRGAPILSPNVERDFSDRGHLRSSSRGVSLPP